MLLLLLAIVAAEEDRYWAAKYKITMKNKDEALHSETV